MIKTRLLLSSAAVFLALYAPNAVAQEGTGCNAQTVINYTEGTLKNGTGSISPDRKDATKALGVPQDDNTLNFVSLGYGGSLTLGFEAAVMDGPGKDIFIVETSYASNDCQSDGIERAQVYLSNDGVNFSYAGDVCRNGSVDIAAAGLTFATQIRIVNDNDASTTPDGYDVDGVYAVNGCTALPAIPDGCFATEIVEVVTGTLMNGQPITDPIRIDPTKALGQPENDRTPGADNFYSLGKGGSLTLKMNNFIITDGTPAADLRVYETTWGNLSCSNYPEYALVEVSSNGVNWYSVGVVCQSSNISLDLDAVIPGGVHVQFVRLTNDDSLGMTPDLFDVDGVEAIFGCDDFIPLEPQGCFASCSPENGFVQGTKKNGGPVASDRMDWTKALGTPEESDAYTTGANNNFVSLGYGGSLTLCFGGFVLNEAGDDVEIIETSFGNPSCQAYPEYADVFISADNITYYFVKTGCHNFRVNFDDAVDAQGNSIFMPYAQYIKIVNNNDLTTTPDGYDVDGVKLLSSVCNDTQGNVAPIVSAPAPVIGFRTYPNPSRGTVNFTLSGYTGGQAVLELYNSAAQRIATPFSGEIQANETNTISFDMSTLPNGIYITKLTTADGVTTGKVMLAK